ncbi:MAG: OmpA family protein [Elusimicrobiota bacterium]
MNRQSVGMRMGKLALFGVLSLGLAGCPPKKKKTVPAEAEAPAAADAQARGSVLEIGPDWSRPAALEPVYFETNKADLSSEARSALKKNAAVLTALLGRHPGVQVRVEGHCDARGTLEYNLALGQRRANALREYYKALGVKKSALSAVSFGEERPLCGEEREECWWKNRRSDTTLRSAAGPVTFSVNPEAAESPSPRRPRT